MFEQVGASASAAQEPDVAKQKEPKAEQAAQEPDVALVPMVKDGECIDVHPTCVADHQRLGWVVKS